MARGDGGVRKREDAKYAASKKPWVAWLDLGPGRDRQGRRKPRIIKEKSFAREREAKDWLDAEKAELRKKRGQVDQSGRLTVEAMLESWYSHGVTVADWSPMHRRRMRQQIAILRPLHHLRADEVTVADVDALIEHRIRVAKSSSNTIRILRNALIAAFNYAIRREELPKDANVAALSSAPKVKRSPPHRLPPHLVPVFIDGLEGEQYRNLIITAMTLALRPSEGIGMRWPSLDLSSGLVTIDQTIQYVDGVYEISELPKDDEPRTIALPPFLIDLLATHQREQMEELQLDRGEKRRRQRQENLERYGHLVFTTRFGGPIHEPGVNRRLKQIIDRINAERRKAFGPAVELLPRVTFYELRHTGATWMLTAGVPEGQLQEIMGHSTPAMTRRYAEIVEPLKREAAARMDAYLEATRNADVGKSVGKAEPGAG